MEQPKLTAMEAFYHLCQLDPHEGESEEDHAARMIMREQFIGQCEESGISVSEYHRRLTEFGDHTVATQESDQKDQQ